jgi:parallel beta-helix repeat protein
MTKNPLIGKCLAVGIILLFVGTCIIPAIAQNTEKPLPTSRGNWLYVGGNGPGNYTRIQDAINASSDGDTVFVFDDSSPYYGNIVIDTSIRVIGEDKNSTIIVGMTGSPDYSSVVINADKVFLSGFTIEKQAGSYGVWIKGNESNITDNIIDDYWYGIYIYPSIHPHKESTKNTIYNNLIKNCFIGLCIYLSSDNVITHNIINNCEMDNRYGGGISVDDGDNTVISNNDVRFNGVGIWVGDSDNVSLLLNNVKENAIGISTSSADNIEIINNNIYLNRERNIVFREFRNQNMFINNNYWGIPRFHPKIICGILLIYLFTLHLDKWNPYWSDTPIYLHLPKTYVDRNPAKEPYDIPEIR